MSDTPERYPLAWPAHKPRRHWDKRVTGSFSKTLEGGKTRKVTIAEAADRCDEEVQRMGGRWPILSTNVELRVNGIPKGGVKPADPGACLYFDLKGTPYAMACDTYNEVEQNIAAIAAHLKAVQAIERYGVGTTAETLQAFTALPPPPQAKPKRPWWEVLGVVRGAVDKDDVSAVFKIRAKKWHPDAETGDAEKMIELNDALKEALKELA